MYMLQIGHEHAAIGLTFRTELGAQAMHDKIAEQMKKVEKLVVEVKDDFGSVVTVRPSEVLYLALAPNAPQRVQPAMMGQLGRG